MASIRAPAPLNELGIAIDIDAGTLARSGSLPPGTVGLGEAIPLDVARIIAKVSKDWDPPTPSNAPEIVVSGKTLAAVGKQLDALPEWGQAGTRGVRADAIPAGTSTDLTVNLHGNLVYRLPRWAEYAQASPAAKAEWDKMFAKLRAHEDRHLQIAIEEADQLTRDLLGNDISEIAKLVTATNKAIQQRQNDLDSDTEHGAKAGVPYGDVTLDTSIV